MIISLLALLTGLLLLLAAADVYVSLKARLISYDQAEAVPSCQYGLILGTTKYLGKSQALNRYYQYRIDAAVELWHAGKIGEFVVSGSGIDNPVSETECMQADLVAAGIPENKIWQDVAGLRTLDSILRFRDTFGQASVCIISQPFHNQRALVQARGLNAVAYNARIIGLKAGRKIHLRERFARLLLWYDLIKGTPPQFTINQYPIKQQSTRHKI